LECKGNFSNAKIKILSNIVASQVKIHAPWGGVVPNLAKREHQKNLPLILKKVFKQAKLSPKKPKIDLIAVTSGPGLEPALWVGINFAKALAYFWNKPILPINHMEGHLFSAFLKKGSKFQVSGFRFPAIA
jgi:N6-L-threonylcarbamoyladenine synthase